MENLKLQFCHGMNILMNFNIRTNIWMCPNEIKMINKTLYNFRGGIGNVLSYHSDFKIGVNFNFRFMIQGDKIDLYF